MARCVNRAIIVGNLGRVPDIKMMPNREIVVSVSVETAGIDNNGREDSSRNEWHRVVFFGNLAKNAANTCIKGKSIYVEGSVKTRKWRAEDGSGRISTEIVANQFHIIE